jgi:hypothetical protein
MRQKPATAEIGPEIGMAQKNRFFTGRQFYGMEVDSFRVEIHWRQTWQSQGFIIHQATKSVQPFHRQDALCRQTAFLSRKS